MRKILSVMLFVFLLTISSPGYAYLFRYDGPYKGKIVDADTGKPIEGVVVLGVWNHETPTAAGAVSSFYDAQETVTDKSGEFEIKGLGLKIFSDIASINITIFKAGYEYIFTPWISFKYWDKIKWEGKKAIIPLKKMTMEERRRMHPDKELIPDNKQRLLIKELNKEYKELGISLYPEVLL